MRIFLSFLAILLVLGCKNLSSDSMFLYFPKSKNDLKENGYELNKDFSFYYKSVQDTLERIGDITPEMKTFSKSFQIKLEHRNQDSATADMNKIADFIKIRSAEIIEEEDNWKLVRMGDFHFFVFYGLSSLKTFCLVSYNNLNSKRQRDASINYLETNLIDNSDSASVQKIEKSINFINTHR